jgi:hypothetical protein
MRYVVIGLWLALAGCSTKEEPKAPPAAVPTPQSLGAIGNNIGKGDSKVASAVTVMIENSDKPPVVQSEGKVALAHLPKPDEPDLKAARDRAAAADPKAYDAEVAKAKSWMQGVEKEWKEAVAQSKKNADELIQARKDLDTSKKEVTSLKDEIKKVKTEADRSLWTMSGVGLFVVGVLTGAIFGWRVGGSILACAPLAAAVPVILSSEYFDWIVGSTLGIAACLLLWRLFDHIKDKNRRTR